MDRQAIYAKTEKGQEEVQNRKFKLPQTLRSLLIMINGATSVGVFLDQARVLGNVASMLSELEQQAFIKKIARVQTSPPIKTARTEINEELRKAQPGEGGFVDFGHLFMPGEAKK